MKKIYLAIIVLGIAGILTGPVAATTVLGQLAMNEARIDGARVPTGTTVISPSKVQTGDAPSVVHLSTGARLYLGPNSGARLAAADTGNVEVAADTGVVQLEDSHGEVMTLASNSLAVIDQEGDVELDPDQRVCVLDSPGDNSVAACATDHSLDGCDWDESTAGELEDGDVYFVPENDDESCDRGIAAWIWGVGGAAAAVVLADELDSSDDVLAPVSPFQP